MSRIKWTLSSHFLKSRDTLCTVMLLFFCGETAQCEKTEMSVLFSLYGPAGILQDKLENWHVGFHS